MSKNRDKNIQDGLDVNFKGDDEYINDEMGGWNEETGLPNFLKMMNLDR